MLLSLLLSLALIHPLLLIGKADRHIITVRETANDSQCFSDIAEPLCSSLSASNELLQQLGDEVTILIEGNLSLKSVFRIRANNTNIIGKHSSNVRFTMDCQRNNTEINIIKCEGNAGFEVIGVSNFSFVNLTLESCTVMDYHQNSFSMFIEDSYEIVLKGVIFYHYRMSALVLINNREMVKIEECHFQGKYASTSNLEQNNTAAAVIIVQSTKSTEEMVHYVLLHTVFCHNFRNMSTLYYSPERKFKDRGFGGAVFIEFGRNTINSSVTLMHSNFVDNKAMRGASIFAYYKENSQRNSITISDSVFHYNSANISGACVNIGFLNQTALSNAFTINNCLFNENFAFVGSGLAIFSVYTNSKPTDDAIIVTNTTWYGNIGIYGAAVDITVTPFNNSNNENEGYLPVPRFYDCTFYNNTVHDKNLRQNKSYHLNVGVFSVTHFRAVFVGKTNFTRNLYSAISLVSGVAEFQEGSHTIFRDNTGYDGGAIAMYGFSTLVFKPNTTTVFSNNQAINYGGAISHYTTDQHSFLKSNYHCFLSNGLGTSTRDEIDSIEVVFENNFARVGGDNIFVASILSCSHKCRTLNNRNLISDEVFGCIGNFTFKNTTHNESHQSLMTSARDFNFSDKNTKSCIGVQKCVLSKANARQFICKVIPGDKICLPFQTIDDFNVPIDARFGISPVNFSTEGVKVRDPVSLTKIIHPRGRPHSSTDFTLSVLGVRQIYFFFNIFLLPCPPGFHFNSTTEYCDCSNNANGLSGITSCDGNYKAHSKKNLWVGYIQNTDLHSAPCDSRMCNNTDGVLSKDRETLVEKVCSKNREGIMCGKCKYNYSTYYNSIHYRCGPNESCNFGFLFYMLSEIIPLVIFLIIVVTFDFSFTSGSSVGFIFFTQHLELLTVNTKTLFNTLRIPYSIFYGLFNLEFFNIEELSFCLWKGAQVLDIIVLKLITAVVALMLIMVLVAIIQRNMCRNLRNIRKRVSTKDSVIHGLSAFLVICYTQCTKTSMYILKYTIPTGYGGSREKSYSYYGGLRFFHSQHLQYAIPAMIVTVLVTILPPLVLLLYPLSLQLLSLCRLSEHRLVNKILEFTNINKLMPFFDCFQGCYKDRLRFFAGLYFVYRDIFLLLFILSYNNLSFRIWCQVLFILILGIHSTVQPYKKKLHNTIDSLVFLNLALVNGCALLIEQLVNLVENTFPVEKYQNIISCFQLFLLYLPLVVLVSRPCKKMMCIMRSKFGGCLCARTSSFQVSDVLDHSSTERSYLIIADNTDRALYGSSADSY